MVSTELSKVNKVANGLPADYDPIVKQATTLKATIWAAKNVETQLSVKCLGRSEVGEMMKFDGSSRPNN